MKIYGLGNDYVFQNSLKDAGDTNTAAEVSPRPETEQGEVDTGTAEEKKETKKKGKKKR